MVKICECCGKRLKISFANTIYCSKCAIHNKERNMQLGYFRRKCDDISTKFYKLKNDYDKLIEERKNESIKKYK